MTTVLLDLDGTLSDSKPGIAASFRYTVAQLGHDPDAAGDLTWAVGPPIAVSMARLLKQYNDDDVNRAVGIYRARYSEVGIYDCSVYSGVVGMLDQFRDAGLPMYIATSKRRDFAERVIDHLGLKPYLRSIYGALPGGGLDEKQDLLAHILAEQAVAPADAVMIGDRLHDIHAARHNNIRPIGVLWGYGERDELLAAGADAVAAHPDDVVRLVTKR